MPQANAIVILFLAFVLRLPSTAAAYSCTPAGVDARSSIRGGMPPADAMVTLFSTFSLRLHSVAAASSCTIADADARSASGGMNATGRRDRDLVLVIRAQVRQYARSTLLHAHRRR